MNFCFFDAMFDAVCIGFASKKQKLTERARALWVGTYGTPFSLFIGKQIPIRYLRDQSKAKKARHTFSTWVRYLFD
jgi:hypothetical protein